MVMTAYGMYINQASTAWDRGDFDSWNTLTELMKCYEINQMEKRRNNNAKRTHNNPIS